MSHLEIYKKKVFSEAAEKLMRSFSRLFRFHSCLPSHLRSLLSLGGANSHHGDCSPLFSLFSDHRNWIWRSLHCFALSPGGLCRPPSAISPHSSRSEENTRMKRKGEVFSVLKTLTSVWPTGLLILKLWKVVMRFKSIFSSKVLLLSQTFTLCSLGERGLKSLLIKWPCLKQWQIVWLQQIDPGD